jgi:hypothetical protein
MYRNTVTTRGLVGSSVLGIFPTAVFYAKLTIANNNSGGISVKLFRILSVLVATTLLCSLFAMSAIAGSNQHSEGFGVKEYDDFHKVLHELQHEALPKNDFSRIRAKAEELVTLGDAIVQLGVPPGTSDAKVEEFRNALKTFGDALAKFHADVKEGTDEQLRQSYSSVHDSFETLADMLPRK